MSQTIFCLQRGLNLRVFNWVSRLLIMIVLSIAFIGCSNQSALIYDDTVELPSDFEAAPNFVLKSLNKADVSLTHYIQDNKVVMLYFWATWNEYSVNSLPDIQDYYNDYSDKGLQILAISIEGKDEQEGVQNFISNNGYTFDVLIDNGVNWQAETFNAYNLKTIPRVLLIDKKGVVRHNAHPNALSRDIIRILLDE